MLQQYGDACIVERKVYKWVDAFKNGRTSICDEQRPGRPSTSVTDENVGRADALIRENRRISVEDLSSELDVSIGSAHKIVTDVLKYHKLCARWVPRMLTDEHKMNRVQTSTTFLARYNDEGEDFLARIVTGDETWVHHYEPESKRQSLEWRHTFSPSKKKFKSQPSSGKVLFTLFWDMNGPIVEHYQKKGETVNSARYSTLLEDELKPAIRSRRRGLLSRGVLLLHDNARPHTAAATLDTIRRLRFQILQHPPYSPDLAPSDYHVFGPMKDALRGRKFGNDDEIKEAVHSWLKGQPKTFFSDGIKKLVQRYEKCIQKEGGYVEK
jgi:histone-lysine N-methyltransferase SETMAR